MHAPRLVPVTSFPAALAALLFGAVGPPSNQPAQLGGPRPLGLPSMHEPGLARSVEGEGAREACRRAPSGRAASKAGPSGAVAARGLQSSGSSPVQPTGYAIPADRPRAPLGRFRLTAYSGPQLGQARAITATGTSARAGRTVAVDPRVIPLGSRIYIEGIGERIAEDVGGRIKGRHIDVYLPSRSLARAFGVRGAIVTLIAAPNAPG